MKRLIAAWAMACAWLLAAPAVAAPGPSYPNASTPLTGAEAMIGTQSGRTVQISVSQIAASATAVGFPRSAIPSNSLGTGKSIIVSGYTAAGDLGAGAIETSNTTACPQDGTGLQAIKDASGAWWCLVVVGQANVGQFGATGNFHWAWFHGMISGTTLTANSVTGAILPGQLLQGQGVAGNPTIAAQLTGTTGGAGTYSISVSQNVPTPSFTGAISGSTLTATGVTGTLAVGQTIAGAGVSSNTVIIASLGGGTYTLNTTYGSPISAEAMTASNNFDSYGGTDDTTAIQAAAATGADVLLPGTSTVNGQLTHYAISAPIALNTKRQNMRMNSAWLIALPGFNSGVNGPMVQSNASRQHFTDLRLDGGAMIGTTTATAFQCAAGVTDSVVSNGDFIHYSVYGIDQEASCRFEGVSTQQWNNIEPMFSVRTAYTAYGRYCNHADSQDLGGYSNWNLSDYYMGPSCQTMLISQLHPYNGGGGSAWPPVLDPVDATCEGDANGAIHLNGIYWDDGSLECYGANIQMSDVWPLQENRVSTYTNACLWRFYPNGAYASPRKLYLSLGMQLGGLDTGMSLLCLPDNPATPAVTTASYAAGTITVTFSGGWTANMPQPTSLNGDITVTGVTPTEYNCTRCQVTASTANSGGVATVSYLPAGAAPGAYVSGGTVQEAWAGDWSFLSKSGGLENPAGGQMDTTSFLTGPLIFINTETPAGTRPDIVFTSAKSAGTTTLPRTGTDIWFVPQGAWSTADSGYSATRPMRLMVSPPGQITLGGASTVGVFGFHSGCSASPCTASNGVETAIQIGSETGAFYMYSTGSRGLVLGTNGTDRLTIDNNGQIKPAVNGGQTSGTSGFQWGATYTQNAYLGSKLTFSSTAPTLASGFGTGATVSGTTAAFVITTGTGPTGTWTLGMPAATTGWVCRAEDVTTTADVAHQTAASLTSPMAPVLSWGSTPTAADLISVTCTAY